MLICHYTAIIKGKGGKPKRTYGILDLDGVDKYKLLRIPLHELLNYYVRSYTQEEVEELLNQGKTVIGLDRNKKDFLDKDILGKPTGEDKDVYRLDICRDNTCLCLYSTTYIFAYDFSTERFLGKIPRAFDLGIYNVFIQDSKVSVTYIFPKGTTTNVNLTLLGKLEYEQTSKGIRLSHKKMKLLQQFNEIDEVDLPPTKEYALELTQALGLKTRVYIEKPYLYYNGMFGVSLFDDIYSNYLVTKNKVFYIDDDGICCLVYAKE
jgi:hypothetical protein